MFTKLVIVSALLAAIAVPTSAFAAPTLYDQCGVIDTWYPQPGYGYDQRWHSEVYPVTIVETINYYGPPEVYAVCSGLIDSSGGCHAAHNHASRPWDYMSQVCVAYVDRLTRIVSYIPGPVNSDTLFAYQANCQTIGGTLT